MSFKNQLQDCYDFSSSVLIVPTLGGWVTPHSLPQNFEIYLKSNDQLNSIALQYLYLASQVKSQLLAKSQQKNSLHTNQCLSSIFLYPADRQFLLILTSYFSKTPQLRDSVALTTKEELKILKDV
jgi:hypothetical protein